MNNPSGGSMTPKATATVLWMRMLDRRRGPDRPAMLAVDPRPTPVAQEADLHLAPRPGTNLALMNGILHEVIGNGWYDKDYVAAHTIGFDELATLLAEYPPERVADICGVPAGQIRDAAAMVGTARRLLSTVLQASTSPTRPPPPPARSTTCTCCAACSATPEPACTR
jgi:anaerobic selenocysteine-containing dehydrogenase